MLKLNIPQKIHVGFQNRNGTYTGKLAYVIYTDAKGKKRKETSWNSWRDSKIDPENFENEPTEGFVLNKGVGGQRESWGWNARNEYIRVYDPRGFEFEISVANLLFILTNCTATKGKGLEGQFVYAWDGTELVLLPVDCFEYKASSEFTELQAKKVTKAEMKEGRVYRHKNTETLIYLGRHKVRDFDNGWRYTPRKENPLLENPTKHKHVFYNIEQKDWHFERGFTKLADIIDKGCHDDYADLYTKFTGSKFVSKFEEVILEPISMTKATKGTYYHELFFIEVKNGYQLVRYSDRKPSFMYGHYNYHTGKRNSPDLPAGMTEDNFWPLTPVVVEEVTKDNLQHRSRYDSHREEHFFAVSKQYLRGKKLFTPKIKLESGQLVKVSNYVE